MWTFSLVRAGVGGCCAAGDTVIVFWGWACCGCMFSGAVGASFWVDAFPSEMPIFLAFITPHWLLDVLVHHYPGIGNEYSLAEKFVSGLCQ